VENQNVTQDEGVIALVTENRVESDKATQGLKPAFAWPETKWHAECPHCFNNQEVDSNACLEGTEHEATCVVCGTTFTCRAG